MHKYVGFLNVGDTTGRRGKHGKDVIQALRGVHRTLLLFLTTRHNCFSFLFLILFTGSAQARHLILLRGTEKSFG